MNPSLARGRDAAALQLSSRRVDYSDPSPRVRPE